MAEMKKRIEELKENLRESYDESQMQLLLHYIARFREEYGYFNGV